MSILQKLGLYGLIPVVVLESADFALSTADALIAGGLPVMEVTLRTAEGLESIRRIAAERPEVEIGAGTVLNIEQAKASVDAGARFIVSPGIDRSLVEWCIKNDVPVTPGCVTPTEIVIALSYGINIVKFFPAGIFGGISAMKALSSPFSTIKFIPTGGVDLANLSDYASAPFVHAVGGSFVCNKADIQAGNFKKIETTTRKCMQTLMFLSDKRIALNTSNDVKA